MVSMLRMNMRSLHARMLALPVLASTPALVAAATVPTGRAGLAFAGGAVAAALSVLCSLRLHRTITRPLHEIADAARRVVSRGDYSVRASKVADDEAGSVADAFNDMLTEIAERIGQRDAITEGRNEAEWIRFLYERLRAGAQAQGVGVPDFADFWEHGWWEAPAPTEEQVLHADFRRDPEKNRLQTPSGRIELFSEKIASFGYDDCPPHPSWIEPAEWLGGAAAKLAVGKRRRPPPPRPAPGGSKRTAPVEMGAEGRLPAMCPVYAAGMRAAAAPAAGFVLGVAGARRAAIACAVAVGVSRWPASRSTV